MLRLLVLLVVAGVRGEVPSDEPSYSLPEGITLEDGDTFEYIVVGAGAAGAAAAARLALAGADVLLVEAGGDPNYISRIPAASLVLMGSHLDYHYETISNNMSCLAYHNRACPASRGKCLGGSTSINHMIYVRGNPYDFDSLRLSGWSWNDIKPYFLRFEGLQNIDLPSFSIPHHNTTGTMKVEYFAKFDNPWHSRVIDGYKYLNVPYNPDVNAVSQIGVSQVIGYTYKNQRMSTARGYLGRDDVKSKLKVAKYTRCTGVIIDDENIARGVTVTIAPFNTKLRLYASHEVVLSAGALSTPQLLMLSGIGHAEHLKPFDIPVRIDLPVGDDMSDHMFALLFVKVDKEIVQSTGNIFDVLTDIFESSSASLGSIGLTDITTFVNTLCYNFDKHQLMNDSRNCELPTTQFIHSYVDKGVIKIGSEILQHATGWTDDVIKQIIEINEKHVLLLFSSLVLHSESRGSVRLSSADPLQPPTIFPNYLMDGRDLEEMVRGIRIIEDMMETPGFKSRGASLVRLRLAGCPGGGVDGAAGSTKYWRCYARHLTGSTFHSAGTTALGRVLDTRLRVRGVHALRVADAGVLPRAPTGNTAAACIALGERVADLLLQDNVH